jgi:hypothetical protein
MKQLISLFIVVFLLQSCGDDVQFNTPALQGNFEGRTWRADNFAGDIDFGGFLLEGQRGIEVLQLITPTDGAGTFELSSESAAIAIFKGVDGTVYSTRNIPDPEVTLYPVEGTITIAEVISTSDPNRVTGTFNFTAFSEDGQRSVNFIDGVVYRVPLTGGLTQIGGTDDNACLLATQALNAAQQVFDNTPTDDPNYTSVCNSYSSALQVAIDSCGDTSGDLQLALDGLGNCM